MGVSFIKRGTPSPTPQQYSTDEAAPSQVQRVTPQHNFQVINPDGEVKPFITPSSMPSNPAEPSYFEKINSAYDTYQKIMNHPLTRGMAKLGQDASFRDNAMKVIAHPSRMSVLYTELVWFLIFMIVRASIIPRVDSFIKRVFTNIFLLLGFWIGATLVPVIVFGKPYVEIYKAIFNAYFGK